MAAGYITERDRIVEVQLWRESYDHHFGTRSAITEHKFFKHHAAMRTMNEAALRQFHRSILLFDN